MNSAITTKQLIFLVIPVALSAMLNNAYRIIDQHAVQWLGIDAQGAIASCTFVLIAFFAGYSIISTGSLALVARAKGGNDVTLQKRLAGNALSAAVIVGIVILSLSGIFATVTVGLLGLHNGLAEKAVSYLRWHALTCLPQAVMPTLDAIFIAYGRTRIVLLLQMTASGFNLILNPVFIYFLGFGIGGAAMATGISQGLALTAGLLLMPRIVKPGLSDYKLTSCLLRIAAVGLPMCWGTLLFAGVYWALLHFVISPLGAPVNAALGIGFSVLEGFTWPVFWGFSMAIASLVGRFLGAGNISGAQQAIGLAFKLLTVAGLAAAFIFWFGAYPLCGLFTENQQVLQEAVLYARILAFSQLFIAYEALSEGVLSGAGDTKTILRWSAPLNVLRIPFCWLFAIHLGYGSAAVWWVINISTIIKALGKWHAVAKGKWHYIKI